MAHVSKDDVRHALSGSRDLAARVVKVSACDGHVRVSLARGAGDNPQALELAKANCETTVRRFAAEGGLELETLQVVFVDAQPGARPDAEGTAEHPTVEQASDVPLKQASSSKTISEGTTTAGSGLPGIRHVIAVGAGKGGVGKSTVSVNLAVALAKKGHAVGLLDGDIYGPSAPTLLGLDSMDVTLHENMLQVFAVHGIKAMTIGKLVEAEKPLIWRGPMAHGAFKQLVEQTSWGELDYLIVDLPPGTGDVPLSMSQMMKLSGAVIVCTPQRVAQDDAVRAARMFQQLSIEVLGVVENMSYFVGDDGKEYDIFGRGGAEQMAQRMGLPFLGHVPINMALRANSDAGDPSANFEEGNPVGASFAKLAQNVENEVALASMRAGGPTLSVS
jgi:ATP-binding protein involved in chromosome partitioning